MNNQQLYDKTEIDKLYHENEKLKKIIKAVFPEIYPRPFICGMGGEKDKMGLPQYIHICPTYGLDGFAIYKKETEYDAPGW